MGILNVTPDSFYDGLNNIDYSSSDYISKYKFADIIDIGAESTRPGSYPISVKEEILRLSSIKINKFKSKTLSIDSYKYDVIEYALNNGFNMINDISGGGKEFKNIHLAKKYNVPIILMHMKGNPKTMQHNPKYKNIIDDLLHYFHEKIHYSLKIGIHMKNIIIDPGIGFGKTFKHNNEILLNLNEFKALNCKVMIGLSRKSFLNINNDRPDERLPQSLGLSAICTFKGVDILRVHDVFDTYKVIKVVEEIM